MITIKNDKENYVILQDCVKDKQYLALESSERDYDFISKDDIIIAITNKKGFLFSSLREDMVCFNLTKNKYIPFDMGSNVALLKVKEINLNVLYS